MRSNEPTVFLLWDFGSEAEQFDYPQLRGVFTEYKSDDEKAKTAVKARDFLARKRPCRKFVIESCSANHLFAESCLGSIDRIEKRKEL